MGHQIILTPFEPVFGGYGEIDPKQVCHRGWIKPVTVQSELAEFDELAGNKQVQNLAPRISLAARLAVEDCVEILQLTDGDVAD